MYRFALSSSSAGYLSLSRALRAGGLSIGLGIGLIMLYPACGVALGQAEGRRVRIVTTNGFGMGAAAEPEIAKRSVEAYADILGFSADQREAALTMHEGYRAQFAQVRKARQEGLNAARRASEDTGDFNAMIERMPPLEKAYGEGVQRLNKSLMEDLRALLEEGPQQARWEGVLRLRRREVELPRGSMSGEAVDLTTLVRDLKLSPAETANLDPAMEAYELEMDRQLKERAEAAAQAPDLGPGGNIDGESLEKAMAKAREASLKVRDTNIEHARKIQGLLPDAKREEFREAMTRRSFPMVYRRTGVMREMDAALALTDLEPGVRQRVEQLRDTYGREAEPLNRAWADAVRESENGGERGAGAVTVGNSAIMTGEDPGPVTDARKARRELDERTRTKLEQLIGEERLAGLKKEEPEEAPMAGGGIRMMIRQTP